MQNLKNTLDTQATFYRQAKENERALDLTEGKRICEEDVAKKDLEMQLLAFKKQLFQQDMISTWQKQSRYRQEIKKIEEEL